MKKKKPRGACLLFPLPPLCASSFAFFFYFCSLSAFLQPAACLPNLFSSHSSELPFTSAFRATAATAAVTLLTAAAILPTCVRVHLHLIFSLLFFNPRYGLLLEECELAAVFAALALA